MAHLREKNGNYYADFYDRHRSPKRKWVPLRCSDQQNARRTLTELERKKALGLFDPWEDDPPQKGVTLSEAVDKFLRYKRDVKGVREKTLDNYKYTLRAFARSAGRNLGVGYVDATHIRAYLRCDEWSRTTRDTYYRQLRTFFRWCDDQNLVRESPIDDVDRPGKPELSPEFLTVSQLGDLIETIREDAEENAPQVGDGEVFWLIDVIKLAVYTGLRRGELCDLRWGAVNLETGFLTVRETEDFATKTGNQERVPLVQDATELLCELRNDCETVRPDEYVFKGAKGGPLNPDYVTTRFRHYRRKAGLPEDISFHSLRHTCASLLMMEGVPLETIQVMLRHSTRRVTERYAHLAPGRLKDQIEEGMSKVTFDSEE